MRYTVCLVLCVCSAVVLSADDVVVTAKTFGCVLDMTKVRNTRIQNPDPDKLKEAIRIFRDSVPAYTLRGYILEAVVYGQGNIAVERQRFLLPDLPPGAAISHAFTLTAKDTREIRVEVRRPKGFSARTATASR